MKGVCVCVCAVPGEGGYRYNDRISKNDIVEPKVMRGGGTGTVIEERKVLVSPSRVNEGNNPGDG